MTRKVEAPGLGIHSEYGEVVTSLITTIEKLAARVEVEAARVIATCPFITDKCQGAVGSDRKDPNAIVQSVGGIDKTAVG